MEQFLDIFIIFRCFFIVINIPMCAHHCELSNVIDFTAFDFELVEK